MGGDEGGRAGGDGDVAADGFEYPHATAESHGDDAAHAEHAAHGHHPVVEDWPRGVGESSWWPLVAAVGAGILYAGVALWLLGRGENSLVGPNFGPLVVAAGVVVGVFGVYGWLYHGFVAHFWTRGTDEHAARTLRWGMLGFIGSEIATFGALFAYYFYIRAGPWPPTGSPLAELDVVNVLVVTNTALLVVSSVTLHFAHHALEAGNRRRFTRLLAITIGLGGLFLAGQAVEYHGFINQEGFTWASGVFASAFFGLTGLHGFHVALGAVMLGIVWARGRHGQFAGERDVGVALAALYWHFVDAVWIALVVVLYIGASVY